MSKELAGCVQSVVGKNNILVKFKEVHRREMISTSLSCVCSKEGVGQNTNKIPPELLKKKKKVIF